MKNGSTVLNTLKSRQVFGAGGWTTGQKVAPNGAIMLRTDTYNAYFRAAGASAFVPELRLGINIDPALVSRSGALGSYAIAMCASNPAIRYIMTGGGELLRTEDDGDNWDRTALPTQTGTEPNEQNRMWGNPLEVDPLNGQHVVYSGHGGTFVSYDGFRTYTAVSTSAVPITAPVDGNPSRAIVSFDPTSSVSNGRTQRYAIQINGAGGGLFQTSNAGVGWSKLPDSPVLPTAASEFKYGPNGWLYLAGNANNDGGAALRIRRTDTNAWVQPQGDGEAKAGKMVAFDPLNPGHVYTCVESLRLDRSTDGGLTWPLGGGNGALVTTDPGEFGWTTYRADAAFIGGSSLDFDASGRLYACGGVGPLECTVFPPTTITYQSTCTWKMILRGVENTVICQVRFAPDGTLGAAKMDRGVVAIAAADVGKAFPAKYGVDSAFQFAQGVDYAPEDYRYWAAASASGRCHGHTPNLNKDWVRDDSLKTLTGGQGGGQIVLLAKDIRLAIQLSTEGAQKISADVKVENGLYLKFKSNEWVAVPIGNGNSTFCAFSYTTKRRSLLHDEHVPYRAWFINPANVDYPASADHIACVGCYRIDVHPETGAMTVDRRSTTTIFPSNGDNYNFHVTQIGVDDFIAHSNTDQRGLRRSTDGMATWPEVTGTDDQGDGDRWGAVTAVGCGLGPNNTRNGTIYVVGYRQNGSGGNAKDPAKYGTWKIEGGATKLIARYPLGIYDEINDIAGHPLRTDTFVIGTNGHGLHLIANEQAFRGT